MCPQDTVDPTSPPLSINAFSDVLMDRLMDKGKSKCPIPPISGGIKIINISKIDTGPFNNVIV